MSTSVSTDTNQDFISVKKSPDVSRAPPVCSSSLGTVPKLSPFLVRVHHGQSLQTVFECNWLNSVSQSDVSTCNPARSCSLRFSTWCKRQCLTYAAAPPHTTPRSANTVHGEKPPVLLCTRSSFFSLFLEELLLPSICRGSSAATAHCCPAFSRVTAKVQAAYLGNPCYGADAQSGH